VRKFLVGLAIAAAAAVMAVVPAQAVPATECAGSGANTTTGPLVVPAGATCTLANVVVDGTIRIMAGGALLTHGSTPQGNVTGNNINLTGNHGPIAICFMTWARRSTSRTTTAGSVSSTTRSATR
jgi:hypothetical protein